MKMESDVMDKDIGKGKRMGKKVSSGAIAGLTLLFFLFLKPGSLYPGESKPRFSVSFFTGYFRPQESAFRELYGNAALQFSFDLSYSITENISVHSGVKYLSCNGETIVIDPQFEEEMVKLAFTMYSIPVAIIVSLPFGDVRPFFGAGVSYNMYDEKWDEFEISFEDKKWGGLVVGGIEYCVAKRFSLLGRFQYSSLPTGQGSHLDDDINLGGFEFSLGFSFHFKLW